MAEVEEGDPPERDVKVCTNSARKCDSRGWSEVKLETDILLGSSQQHGNTFIHTYLTSLPLVSVYCRGHVPGWKSRRNFNSSTNSIFVCAQFTLWQMHWTNLSVSIQAKYWGYILTLKKREDELWKLPLNSWLKIELKTWWKSILYCISMVLIDLEAINPFTPKFKKYILPNLQKRNV